MRDFLVLSIILGSVPICLFYPYYGVLMWVWIAYFNPHRFAWGMAYDFPVAAVVAVPTILGTVFARKTNRPFLVRETLLLLMLWAWFALVFLYAKQVPLFSGHMEEAEFRLAQVSKILLMTILTMLLVCTRKRLKYLYVVTAFSFGLLALKGTVFGFLTGGQFRVWGPTDSFVADNNDFALALNMAMPMLFFLAWDDERRWFRILCRTVFLCCIVAVVLTYSRGGLLGLAVVLAGITLRSRHKVLAVLVLLLALPLALTMVPAAWSGRMEQFLHGHLDESAEQRIAAWQFALNFSHHFPITGGSFEVFPDKEVFQRYQVTPIPGGHLAAGPHSIYFEMLGEQGYVGLFLYLTLLFSCCLTLWKVRRRAKRLEPLKWMVPYVNAIEVGLLAFMVSGAFLGRACFDLFFELVACSMILKSLYLREVPLARESLTEARAADLVGAEVS